MEQRIDPMKPNKAGKTLMDYLPIAAQKLGLPLRPKDEMTDQQVLPEAESFKEVIDKKAIDKAVETLKRYKEGKSNLESRIVEEERWYKLRHWEIIRGKKSADMKGEEVRPEPTSAWLFNSIANKHADIMDNYPEPNVLPREQMDEKDADTLSAILPVVYERNNYEQTYSQAAWYLLKHGVAAKGTFWNQDLEEGLGDVHHCFVDVLNLFWEPGITDIQNSRNLFVVTLKDNDLLEAEYPQLKGKLKGQVIDVKEYVHDDNVDTSDKSLVIDWYYKKRNAQGKTILHLCKFVGSEILFASENEPQYAQDGFYQHGRYPVELDVLFPEEGTPVGFGYIALMKSPQLFIDKLNQVILENSMMAAKPRYFRKKNAGINDEQFADWSVPLVDFEGDVNNLKPIEVAPVPAYVMNALQMKIDELKETSSNRDVSQGSSSGGVTAAAAIAALQEAGNKTSRDMINSLYRGYTRGCYLTIELIRQFYDEQRTFRITGERGENEYVQFSNASLQPQPIPPAYPGQEMEPGYSEASRKPIFDVVVKPQKRSPYSKMAQNELAKELYGMGFFNPQMADQSLAALDLMDFDGIEKVRDKVQQGQTLMSMVQMLQQQVADLSMQILQMTGRPIPEGGPSVPPAHQSPRPVAGGDSMGRAQKEAQTANMTAYGERLAAHARPNVEAQA